MNNNYELAMRYKDVPLTIEIFKTLQGRINGACRHYILGQACIAERTRRIKSGDSLDGVCSEYGYSNSSMEKFVSYAKAIDSLQFISPELVVDIIEGNVRLSMENTILASYKKPDEILRIVEILSDKNVKVSDIFPTRFNKTRKKTRPAQTAVLVNEKSVTIKDTPTYDPDAPVSSLAYTMPSWVSAIEKVFMNVDFGSVSLKARYRLRKELVVLADTAGVMLDILKEEK